MATVNVSYKTLADRATEVGRAGDQLAVIEMLSEVNPLFDHAMAVPCNEGSQHKTSVRTGLPAGTWTALYEGIPQEKSRRRTVSDATARIEALSTVDKRLLDISKDPAQTRLDEASAFIEGMSQSINDAILYSDLSDAKKFLGLTPRFDSLTAENGGQIVNASGAQSDNQSVWMITWSPRTCHLIYPDFNVPGKAMIERKDKGEQRVLDDNGNPYYVMEEHFACHVGISVRDWRYVGRIANIDVSDLIAGSVNTLDLMRQLFYKTHARAPINAKRTQQVSGKTCIYASRTFIEALDEDMSDKTNVELTIEQAGGVYRAASAYRGIPIYELDSLLDTEAVVS